MKPYPNQVLSMFREGLDTKQLAIEFRITEAEAYALLDEARKSKPNFVRTFTPEMQKRARNKARLACKSTKPVSLPTLKFLESKA